MFGLAGLVVFERHGEVEQNFQQRSSLRMSRNAFPAETVLVAFRIQAEKRISASETHAASTAVSGSSCVSASIAQPTARVLSRKAFVPVFQSTRHVLSSDSYLAVLDCKTRPHFCCEDDAKMACMPVAVNIQKHNPHFNCCFALFVQIDTGRRFLRKRS